MCWRNMSHWNWLVEEVSRADFFSYGSQFEDEKDDQEDEDGEGDGDDDPEQDLDSVFNNQTYMQISNKSSEIFFQE